MKLNILLVLVLVLSITSCSVIQDLVGCEGVCNDTSDNNVSENETEDLDSFDIILSDEDDIILNMNDTELNDSEEEFIVDEESSTLTVKVLEGETVKLNLQAEDPDGDLITYTYSEPLNENGSWKTEIGDAGTYMATVSASDSILTTTETVTIIVESTNKAPIIECPDSVSFKEGELVDIVCTFSDPEGEKVTYNVHGFIDSLQYNSTYDDAGTYKLTVSASDGIQSSQKEILLIIENVNRAPVISFDAEELVVAEKDTVQIDYTAEDPDGDEIEVEFSEPLDENGVWVTDLGDAGEYEVNVVFSDGEDFVTKTIFLTVNEFNSAPIISIDDIIYVKENEEITLPVEVTDPNGDEVTISVSGFMNDLTYTTTYDDAGEHEVIITATDGTNTVSKTITLVVENVNRPPVFVNLD